MYLSLVKVNGAWYPADDESKEVSDSLRYSTIIAAEVKDSDDRSGANLRRFFKFINTAFRMQDHYSSKEIFRKELLILSGYSETWVSVDGQVRVQAKSISYAELRNEDKFRAIFKNCIEAFISTYEKTNGAILTYEEFMAVLGEIEEFR